MRQGGGRRAWLALALVLAYVGWAGLRPFDFSRRNAVSWIATGPGLFFAGGGRAVSRTDCVWDTRSGPARFGLALWLRKDKPSADLEDVFVLEDMPDHSFLGLAQHGADLIFYDRVTNPDGERWYNDLRFSGVLAQGALQHVAVSSGSPGTRVWIDGRRVEAASGYAIPIAPAGEPLAGRLCVGAGPHGQRPWTGQVLGLALFERELSDPEVLRYAAIEPGPGLAEIAGEPGCLALFAFDEGSGRTVHDLVPGGPELELPAYFRPVGTPVLGLPAANELTSAWNLLDVGVNLFGFVPLGWVLGVILARRRHAGVSVFFIAFVLSLAIELLQSLSVSRNSSLLDLSMNVGGAMLGWGLLVWLPTSRAPTPGSRATR